MQPSKQLVGPINLLPATVVREQQLDNIKTVVSCFLLLVTALLMVTTVQFQHKINWIQQELAAIQQPATQAQNLELETSNLKAKLAHEQKREYLLRNQTGINPASDLSHIETMTPAGIKPLRINFSFDKLSVTGQAIKPQDIALFLQQLQHRYGNSIRLSACQIKDDNKYYFQIEGEREPY